ncbi:MAG: hypothetical protein P0Y64_08540 [Candidatus Sphingomonas colombiensis]|nr:hypothetical protein [Sphingomonas sp.]WEK44803.1 MAG: hypothetical protein P0Y64_08540 [Sphingomonas sp.]
MPISGAAGSAIQPLGGLAEITPLQYVPVVSHYNIQPVIEFYADDQGRDLGAVGGTMQHAIDSLKQGSAEGLHRHVLRGSMPP